MTTKSTTNKSKQSSKKTNSRAFKDREGIIEANLKDLTSAAISAIQNDEAHILRALLRAGLPTDSGYDVGKLIHASILHMSFESLVALIEFKADVNIDNRWKEKAIHLAAELDFVDAIKVLMEAGAEIDPRDGVFRTPLMRATMKSSTSASKFLVDNGADINATNLTRTESPLLNSINARNNELIIYLLDRGADTSLVQPPYAKLSDIAKDKGVKRDIIRMLRDEEE
ncbi:MAG: ankyrin repeat domain-containing protein [Methanobacteriota archaeon]|nr:MAG: ankyrin repeat domain-containing protein [Euryarchaeota archaeon]